MKKNIAFLALAVFFYCISCTTDGPSDKPLNPNGDSELALLMRAMFDDGLKMKTQLQNGEMPALSVAFEKIHTATPTEPGKSSTPEYQVHALSYEQAVKALKTAAPGEAEASYTRMVDACMNCHRAICPGPMVRIKKLYL